MVDREGKFGKQTRRAKTWEAQGSGSVDRALKSADAAGEWERMGRRE